MEVRFGNDQLLGFYEVFARNMRDLGTPVLPRAFFERIVEVFRDLGPAVPSHIYGAYPALSSVAVDTTDSYHPMTSSWWFSGGNCR